MTRGPMQLHRLKVGRGLETCAWSSRTSSCQAEITRPIANIQNFYSIANIRISRLRCTMARNITNNFLFRSRPVPLMRFFGTKNADNHLKKDVFAPVFNYFVLITISQLDQSSNWNNL